MKEKERRENPMKLSREFTEKFSEIFLDENMADVLQSQYVRR
jgi:hypothetical protein